MVTIKESMGDKLQGKVIFVGMYTRFWAYYNIVIWVTNIDLLYAILFLNFGLNLEKRIHHHRWKEQLKISKLQSLEIKYYKTGRIWPWKVYTCL
jgi:hypothetical protein